MARVLRCIATGAGTMLAVAACGGAGSTGGSGSGSTESISVEAQDFQFSPTTLTVPMNTAIHLTVHNAGSVHHNFTIKELGVNKDVETPGKSESLSFDTKESVSYTFYCEYHRDSKGMKGTLVVGNPSGANPAPAPASSASASVPYGY